MGENGNFVPDSDSVLGQELGDAVAFFLEAAVGVTFVVAVAPLGEFFLGKCRCGILIEPFVVIIILAVNLYHLVEYSKSIHLL